MKANGAGQKGSRETASTINGRTGGLGGEKVCNGTLTLKQAQKAELAYKRKYG